MQCLKRIFLAALCSVAMVAYAEESAPVYDVDASPADQAEESTHAQGKLPAQALTLEQRISRAEQQINNMQRPENETKLNDLHNELQSLRGQVDELTHQFQLIQTQQKAMFADLDKRINKLSSQTTADKPVMPVTTNNGINATKSVSIPGAVSLTSKNNTGSAQQPNVAEEQQTYQIAYDLIKAKKYNEAVNTLQKMLQKYPSGQFAANAHYWLGELYGLMGKNEESAMEFDTVVKNYPDSPKVSDAQLKVGLIYAAQFKWSDAKGAFKKVINHYPGTASARLATEQLKQMKQAGH